jgi:hypothetical protein
LRNADRRGGNQNAKIEKMTEAEPIVSSNPPKSSLFRDEFFNNIGRQEPVGPPPASNEYSRPILLKNSLGAFGGKIVAL